MSSIQIRHVRATDVDAILAILATAPQTAQWTRSQLATAIADPQHYCIVAEREIANERLSRSADPETLHPQLRVIGFLVVGCGAPDWELENLAVAPAQRGFGVGTRLVTALLQEAQIKRAESVLLEVRESNAAARRLYEREGFQVAGIRRTYYQNPIESAVIYRKNLKP